MSIINLTSTELRKAADLQDKIASLQKELSALTGAGTSTPATKPAKKKGGMSAAGRARIIAAQKLRWAKVKAANTAEAPAKSEAKPAKRKMSEAGRAAISVAAKARWAKYNAAKK